MMWGIIGMFLATPITAAVRILLSRLEITRPLAELMSGRWENIGNSTAFSHSTRSA
jgi:AI-2 transport protein TqsA